MEPAPTYSVVYVEGCHGGAESEDVAYSFVAETAAGGFGVDVCVADSGVGGFYQDVGWGEGEVGGFESVGLGLGGVVVGLEGVEVLWFFLDGWFGGGR